MSEEANTPIYKRVNDAIKANPMINQKIVALNMGITESRLSYLLNGGRRLTVDDFLAICKACSFDPKNFFD